MNDINYTDTALDDFMSRFGSDEVSNERKKVKNINAYKADNTEMQDAKKEVQNNIDKGPEGVDEELEKSNGVSDSDVSEGITAAKGVYGLARLAGGKGLDTDADSGGPGKAGGTILKGAGTGAKTGAAIGMLAGGPVGAAIGAIGGATIGAGIGIAAHSGAMRTYGKELTKKNLSLNTLEKAKAEETYAIEQGKESLGLLKGLRQKQLGIINT